VKGRVPDALVKRLLGAYISSTDLALRDDSLLCNDTNLTAESGEGAWKTEPAVR
jgi:hypothetical protein